MILSWIGLLVAFGGIILGQMREGGNFHSLVEPTAAMIVFGGTLGATLLSCTVTEFSGAIRGVAKVFLHGAPDMGPLVKEIVAIATSARREGILSLEKVIPDIKNTFFATNLRHVVDGYDPGVLKEIMEERITMDEEEKNACAKVYETAGGFAPTVGILGAVMGLIHVMENLGHSKGDALGAGIATAFVATVYGVGCANLILLPIGNKLKKIGKEEILEMTLIAAGLMGIQNGLNPRVIEDRLVNLLGEHSAAEGGEGAAPAEKKAA